jgi:hypothetical protein
MGEREADDGIAEKVGGQELGVEVSVLVLKLISHAGLRPYTRRVIALVGESSAVHVFQIEKETIGEIERRNIATAVGHVVFV